MPYPLASGAGLVGGAGTSANPAYSGVFIPQIWSGKLIEKFYDSTVLAAIANTDWEGEVKNQGDKVIIRTKPTISIANYSADQSLALQRPSSNIVEMNIDKGKYFNTILDDVMETQADLNLLSLWADDAAEQMKIAIDRDVLLTLSPSVTARNKGANAGRLSQNINLGANGAPVTITAANVIDKIIELGQVLDEQNIPETGRWLVLPPWFASFIKKSDIRNASIAGGDQTILRNGRLGQLDRFTLYSSNLLPTSLTDVDANGAAVAANDADGATFIFAGHAHGLAFASQMSKMETLRSESTFGTLMRGLQVYGSKIVDGTAIAQLYAKP